MSTNFFFGTGLLIRYEERTVNSGKKVSSFCLVLSEPRPRDQQGQAQQKDGTFIDVESWNVSPQLSQALNNNVKKVRVSVQGRLRQDRWQDKQTGANRSALKVVANVVTIAGFVGQNNNQGQAPVTQQPVTQQPAAQPAQQVAQGGGQKDEYGNDIPF